MTGAPAPARNGERIALALLLAISFPLSIIAYNHMGEDSYISFRYARNFAEGHGLVFNIGEREEGYSNFLWVIVLAVFERIGARMDVAARILSMAALAGAALLGWSAARRVAPDSACARLWLAAALCFHPLMRYHADRGLETVPIACTMIAGLFIVALRGPMWIAGALGGATALLRPEGVGFALSLVPVAWLAADGPMRARFIAAAKYAAIPLACFAAQMLFRKMYYCEWLPNTVVAKRHGGPGSAWEIATWIASTAFTPILAALGAAWSLRKPETRALGAGVLCVFVACGAFQAISGKLVNEGWRYIAPAFPATVLGCWLLALGLGEKFDPAFVWSKARTAGGLALLAAILILPCKTPSQGKTRLFEGNRDALRSRLHVRVIEFFKSPNPAFYWEWFFHDEIFLNAEAGKWVAENLPAKTLIAGDQLGQLGYYSKTNQSYLDLLGLMDKRIAKQGAVPSDIASRNPDYFVVLCFDHSDFWPRELRGIPMVPAVKDVLFSPEISGIWRPSIILEPRETLTHCNFTVYSKIPKNTPPRTVKIGPDTLEFEKWWRVL